MKYHGAKIRARRESLGLTQEALAEAIGRSVSSINRFERNKTEPRASELLAIAKALKCGMELFFR